MMSLTEKMTRQAHPVAMLGLCIACGGLLSVCSEPSTTDEDIRVDLATEETTDEQRPSDGEMTRLERYLIDHAKSMPRGLDPAEGEQPPAHMQPLRLRLERTQGKSGIQMKPLPIPDNYTPLLEEDFPEERPEGSKRT